MIGGLKDVKKVCILALYFMLFCLVFIRFNGQNYQKPTENEVKVEENIPLPFDKFKKEYAELMEKIKDDYIRNFICVQNEEEYQEMLADY